MSAVHAGETNQALLALSSSCLLIGFREHKAEDPGARHSATGSHETWKKAYKSTACIRIKTERMKGSSKRNTSLSSSVL